jgi:UDP-N-acetylglucosamine--N-acetylmuramyl-(pentapeptide) pyrophosphoryl-undecaprenol N-acetylglucosamine transferase
MEQAVIVAGGTAGHINAALSLGELLRNNNYNIEFITGTRYLDKKLFNKENAIYLDSKPLRTKNPLRLFLNLGKNLFVFLGLIFKFLKVRPKFIVGAGGYVCGPSLMAAWILGIPIYIIEQNAAAGVTNKILARFSKKVFTHFKTTKGLEDYQSKIIVSGNPVRSKITYSKAGDEEKNIINILVFGGSLGATQINDAIGLWINSNQSGKLEIKHQVGKSNNFHVEPSKNIQYEQLEYIDDMQAAYEWADIVISRAGASTISELRIVGKPSILIPYPAATDNHQYFNAMELKNENLFHVDILDQKLKGKALAEKIDSAVNNIVSNKLFNAGKTVDNEASNIIYQEINKDVWNK